MTRKEFISQVGNGVAFLIVPACITSLTGCSEKSTVPAAPTNVDFTLDVSTGALSSNGGFLVKDGIIIARTNTGGFLAVSAACTHEGTTIQFQGSTNNFRCPNHGSTFNTAGQVTVGPAARSLAVYNTSVTGTSLRVFS